MKHKFEYFYNIIKNLIIKATKTEDYSSAKITIGIYVYPKRKYLLEVLFWQGNNIVHVRNKVALT